MLLRIGLLYLASDKEEAAMRCEHCNSIMIERPPTPERDDAEKGQAIVLECRKCGHTECQPLVRSFWRRLAA